MSFLTFDQMLLLFEQTVQLGKQTDSALKNEHKPDKNKWLELA